MEEERSQVISQINENKKNLEDIENKILSVLFSSKGNILEDEIAIKTLSSSKVLANEIVEKQTTAEAAKSRIDESRNEYYALTKYAVTLYFTGEDIALEFGNYTPMQYLASVKKQNHTNENRNHGTVY